jgi:putative ABC transport system permease protein
MTATSQPVVNPAPDAVRLRPADLAGLAAIGLASRKLRAGLSALGIAIGVAAIVAVLGLAASSTAILLTEISRLGTNLLTVTDGQTLSGQPAELADAAPEMIARLPDVTAVQDTGAVGGVSAYRSPLIPPVETNALAVTATTLGLPPVAGTGIAQGQFLNAATAREPVTVLGAQAAQSLGIDRIGPGERIWLCASAACPAGGQWFYVTGILNPIPDTYAPEINSAVLVGFPAAVRYLGLDGHPSEIYVRTSRDDAAATAAVHGVLAAEASPENPAQVNVSQPSTALTAQADAKGALDTLFLGLGAVALLVGAIGVANIMVISVLERRSEIGLRRALGATRGQIRAQFLSEAILLSLAGGVVGVLVGAAATVAYARSHGEPAVIPLDAWAGGLAAAILIGALAGLLPAIRAARLTPTQALWKV